MPLIWPKKIGAGRVDMATKSNGIFVSMPYWDERFRAVAAEYPDITRHRSTTSTSWPRGWSCSLRSSEVVVATNLFGDILSRIWARA